MNFIIVAIIAILVVCFAYYFFRLRHQQYDDDDEGEEGDYGYAEGVGRDEAASERGGEQEQLKKTNLETPVEMKEHWAKSLPHWIDVNLVLNRHLI